MSRVLVTGGASGLGAALVRQLLAQGNQVVATDLSEPVPDGAAYLRLDVRDEQDWEAAVQEGLSEPWVVQERVHIPEEVFPRLEDDGEVGLVPLKVNVNPFFVDGADVGAVTRASRSSVINVSAGGGSVPTFVVG